MLRIVKIDGQEPTYRVELEATKVGFASVDKLVGQQSFRPGLRWGWPQFRGNGEMPEPREREETPHRPRQVILPG